MTGWRGYLTDPERAALDTLERSAAFLDNRRKDITAKRNVIVNRAVKRQRARERALAAQVAAKQARASEGEA